MAWFLNFGGYFVVFIMVGSMIGIFQAVPLFWAIFSVVGALAFTEGLG